MGREPGGSGEKGGIARIYFRRGADMGDTGAQECVCHELKEAGEGHCWVWEVRVPPHTA